MSLISKRREQNDFYSYFGCCSFKPPPQNSFKKEPKRGWELPGGLVENSETIKNTAIREVKEETGILIEIEKFCGISQELSNNICNFWWQGKAVGRTLTTNAESLEVGFFNLEEALKLIEKSHFKTELLSFLDENKQPFTLFFY